MTRCSAPRRPGAVPRDARRESGLSERQDAGAQQQRRCDPRKRPAGKHEQQRRADQRAEHRTRHERPQQAALPAQPGAHPDDAREVAGNDADVVGDIGRQRRQADGDEDREGEQRARAGDDVGRPGGDAGGEDGRDLDQVHGRDHRLS